MLFNSPDRKYLYWFQDSSQSTLSGSTTSSHYESLASTVLSRKSESLVEIKAKTQRYVDSYEADSDFVEVEKKTYVSYLTLY